MRSLITAMLVVVSAEAAGAAYGAREILDARRRLYDTTYAWSDQREVLRVTMVDAQARKEERTIELYERRYPDGGRKTLLVFRAPDNLKGTAVLSQERALGAPERWLYLPRQGRARRFAGQMSDEGLLGTDLTAGEIDLMHQTLKWTVADVRARLRGRERVGEAEAYALEVLDVKPYGRIVLWVGAVDLVMRQLELYAADATMLKRIRQVDVKLVGAVPVPSRVEVEDPRDGSTSTFDVVEIEFDVGFSDDVFSLPLLASPHQ